ncbi:MAG TPA: phenylalanine--tRNA ligase subunit beta [Candidatus Binatia bacterium]|nr:phenylalanine--tRNA ligase subunit beta [Candidatus Binatia bacterium]
MRTSLAWLRAYADLDAPVDELVRALVDTGTEADRLEQPVVARVAGLSAIPESTRGVRFADIDAGTGTTIRVITGAPNVKPGDLVAYGPPGAVLPGLSEPLQVRSMFEGRYSSPGMLLSEVELGVGEDASGLLILDRGRPGQPLHEVIPSDVILDLAVTTNRPDCLCHLGIARELAAALAEPLRPPAMELAEAFTSATSSGRRARVRIDDPRGCHRFTARVIEGVVVGESPQWLQRRLRAVGLRPINSVVDVTNYVTHELGHPLHAFDLDRLLQLQGGGRPATLTVRRARPGESLECLDGETRRLDDTDMAIAVGDTVVSLAGVIGGVETGVETRTTRVLLEAACWEPGGIRATSRRHSLRTDASNLFEKGLPDELSPLALDRAAGLIAETAGGHVLRDLIDEHPAPLPPLQPITVTAEWLSDRLGFAVDLDEAATALARLEFAVEHGGEQLTVLPPYFRRDVTIAEDVLEEVGRSLGYSRLPSTLPGRRVEVRRLAEEDPVEEAVRDVCVGAGFDEVLPYVFVRPEVAARVPGLGGGRTPIALRNPLSEEMTHLRVSLLPGLCETLALNLHRGVEGAAIFELGRAFWEGERDTQPAGSTPDGADRGLPPLPAEPLLVATAAQVMGGAGEAALELRRCQALLEWLIGSLSGEEPGAEPAELPGLRPGRSAWVTAGSRRVGVVGELDLGALEGFDLRGRVAVAELRLDALVTGTGRRPDYQPVPRFPAVVQDLSVTVRWDRRAGDALAAAREAAGSLLEAVELTDEFRGQQVGEGRKGWTFRLTFRQPDRTLTSEEAQRCQEAIVQALRQRCGAELRQ